MIPILGWNMDGGDLRIPHFVGIHGAQFIPLVAGVAMLFGARGLSLNRQRALVAIGATFYFGLTALVTWQALRNESVVVSSAETLGAGFALLSFAGIAVGAVLCGAQLRIVGEMLAVQYEKVKCTIQRFKGQRA